MSNRWMPVSLAHARHATPLSASDEQKAFDVKDENPRQEVENRVHPSTQHEIVVA
jgi:hypothetical protein